MKCARSTSPRGLCRPLPARPALAALVLCALCLCFAPAAWADGEGGVSMGNAPASATAPEAGIRPVFVPAGASESAAGPTAQAAALAPRLARTSTAAGVGPFAPSVVYAGGAALPGGAITVHPDADAQAADNLDDYDDEPVASIADPIEPWNRFWFHFNDIFFMYIAKPAYTGWTWLVPECFRSGLSNFFHNLLFPTRFINNLLQFRFFEAGVEFGRFMMNTMSSAGFANVAKNKKTIVPVDPSGEDFGQTLGRWGFGQGFYVVWPFIGPSSLRDTIGRIGDYFTDPLFYVRPWELSTGAEVGFRFNDLGDVLPTYEDLKTIAVDPYLAMREAYANYRNAQVRR
ncbi:MULTISPECIES: VacJ family lipoprotein [unclassified Desulfovibrio]|uniref:MlaA family lipoprotein n=1 Tax=unclassified Desulfovibrio TaxID=2593640 RepID=UPI001F14F0AE|nr:MULTISPECIES: VacJ family lipoprotein [unclassified Desulfovibrio]